MTKQEFLDAFQDVLQRDDAVAENDALVSLDEWDSLAKMATMAYFKKHFDIAIMLNRIGELKNVSELIALAGDKIQ
jgi:acyl carrier protein